MTLACRTVPLEKAARGLVVRPRPGGGPDQTLVFLNEGGIHELEGAALSGGRDLKLGLQLASMSYGGWRPVYDSASRTVYVSGGGVGATRRIFDRASQFLGKLDASNCIQPLTSLPLATDLAAGPGAEAVSKHILSLAADGQGGVWMMLQNCIRRLDVRSEEITTLAGLEVQGSSSGRWRDLAFDPCSGTLWLATRSALCRVHTGGQVSERVELVAGDWDQLGSVDGSGTAARFCGVEALLPVSGGRLLIADGPDLRCMDAGGAVTTLLRGCSRGCEARTPSGVLQMALLPSGEVGAVMADGSLLLIGGGDFAPATSAAATDRLLSLLAPQAAEEDGDGGGSEASSSSATALLSGAVTVRVGVRAFLAHRSVLAAGSEYFARLLAPGGGFEESGAPEVALHDADPAAFAHLLSYMYFTSLGASSQILSTPPELLRPTAALAGRLLMGGAVAALTERLAAAATPASVLSDLAWSDAHGLTELAERLRAVAVRNRRALDPSKLQQLVRECPEQAGALLARLCSA